MSFHFWKCGNLAFFWNHVFHPITKLSVHHLKNFHKMKFISACKEKVQNWRMIGHFFIYLLFCSKLTVKVNEEYLAASKITAIIRFEWKTKINLIFTPFLVRFRKIKQAYANFALVRIRLVYFIHCMWNPLHPEKMAPQCVPAFVVRGFKQQRNKK